MIKFRTINNKIAIGFVIGLFHREVLFWYDKSSMSSYWPPRLNRISHDALYIGRFVIDWDRSFTY